MELGDNGCGYALRIDEDFLEASLAALNRYGIVVLRAYRHGADGYAEVEL